ncbi:MAG: hypothetical protein PHX83_12125 [Acidobacteriia bacterium]|nr:hypothetical protein [Terriglobia bacterium]
MKKVLVSVLIFAIVGLVHGQWTQLSTQDAINAALKNDMTWIGKSAVYGKTPIYQIGINTAVAATDEDVTIQSGVQPYLNYGQTLKIVSSNQADDTSGTGATCIVLTGLDSSYTYYAASKVYLGGKDTVSSSVKFVRIWDAKVTVAGTGGINDGAISITNSTGDTVLALIDSTSGYARSPMALLTVPDNKTFYMTSITAQTHTNKATVISLYVRPSGAEWYLADIFEIQTGGPVSKEFSIPLVFDEKTDIALRANASGGAGHVTASFAGWWE